MERERRREDSDEPVGAKAAAAPAPHAAILGLQQSAGNAAVTQLLRKDKPAEELKAVKVNHERISVKPPEPGLKFSPEPAGLTGVKYSIEGDGATIDKGTTVAADGTVTLGADQTGGRAKAKAEHTDPEGTSTVEQPINLVEDPGAISGTSASDTSTKTHYRADFTHTFKPAQGAGSAVERAHLNEQFGGALITDPKAKHHDIKSPFGDFGLDVNDPASVTDGWDLGSAGEMVKPDHVSISKGLVNARKFVVNASNPSGAGLPQKFSVTQNFHSLRFPSAKYGATPVASTSHVRTLRDNAGSLEVVLESGGKEVVIPYEGPSVFRNAKADKASVEASTADSANTVSIAVESFGNDATAHYKIVEGAKLATVDGSGTVTIGKAPGTVKVRVGDKKFENYDEVSITITAPKAAGADPKAESGEPSAAWGEPPSE